MATMRERASRGLECTSSSIPSRSNTIRYKCCKGSANVTESPPFCNILCNCSFSSRNCWTGSPCNSASTASNSFKASSRHPCNSERSFSRLRNFSFKCDVSSESDCRGADRQCVASFCAWFNLVFNSSTCLDHVSSDSFHCPRTASKSATRAAQSCCNSWICRSWSWTRNSQVYCSASNVSSNSLRTMSAVKIWAWARSNCTCNSPTRTSMAESDSETVPPSRGRCCCRC
mmetsp:Transcript_20726/g.39412  ORF Transcript_20726/g.39412 Transcript_20726/m.39412 type:complete len:230 (-) Transcript_20726:792-1481(-)